MQDLRWKRVTRQRLNNNQLARVAIVVWSSTFDLYVHSALQNVSSWQPPNSNSSPGSLIAFAKLRTYKLCPTPTKASATVAAKIPIKFSAAVYPSAPTRRNFVIKAAGPQRRSSYPPAPPPSGSTLDQELGIEGGKWRQRR